MNRILTRTPLRISFAGGGTDKALFYERFGGSIISTAIDKFITIYITEIPDKKVVLLTGIEREEKPSADEIAHPIVREALQYTGTRWGVSIRVESDMTAHGCGLGTSSALTVGLVQGLSALAGMTLSPNELAEAACHIEIDRLGCPIGKQDQYIAAHGGFRKIDIDTDGTVSVQPVPARADLLEALRKNLLLFDTGIERSASRVLGCRTGTKFGHLEKLRHIKKLVKPMYKILTSDTAITGEIAHLFDLNYHAKRHLNLETTNPIIDKIYNTAMETGALGGRLLGAGGGGHILFYVPIKRQWRVGGALGLMGLKQIPFRFYPKGCELWS